MEIIIWGKEEYRKEVEQCIEEKLGVQQWEHSTHHQKTDVFQISLYDEFFNKIIEDYQDIKLTCYDIEDDEDRDSGFWISHELKTEINEEGKHIAVYSSGHYWS